MSEVPLTRRKPVKTAEQIRQSPNFAALKSANQREFVLMIAAGSSPMAAIGSVYHFQCRETSRRFMYALFKRPPMKAVLHEVYGEGNKTDFLRDLDRASKNSKTTPAQVQALLIVGVARGFVPSNFSLSFREDELELVDD
jgi:hypothetical protein